MEFISYARQLVPKLSSSLESHEWPPPALGHLAQRVWQGLFAWEVLGPESVTGMGLHACCLLLVYVQAFSKIIVLSSLWGRP